MGNEAFDMELKVEIYGSSFEDRFDQTIYFVAKVAHGKT